MNKQWTPKQHRPFPWRKLAAACSTLLTLAVIALGVAAALHKVPLT